MRVLLTIFCESFSDKDVFVFTNIMQKLSYKPKLMFVAITPLACYQLERYKIKYEIPESYLPISDIEFDPYKETNSRLRIFSLYTFEKQRTRNYWKLFLDEYLNLVYKDRTPYIIYFGKQTGLSNELQTNEVLCKGNIHKLNCTK